MPLPLRRFLHPHRVDTCAELGWSDRKNGDRVDRAVAGRYEALITTDQNLRHQHASFGAGLLEALCQVTVDGGGTPAGHLRGALS